MSDGESDTLLPAAAAVPAAPAAAAADETAARLAGRGGAGFFADEERAMVG